MKFKPFSGRFDPCRQALFLHPAIFARFLRFSLTTFHFTPSVFPSVIIRDRALLVSIEGLDL